MNAIKRAIYGTVAAATAFTSTRAIDFGEDRVIDPIQGGNAGIDGIQNLIENILGLVGIIAVAFAIYGGFLILTGGANEENVAKGRKTLLYAVIGIIVIALAYSIVTLVINNIIGGQD